MKNNIFLISIILFSACTMEAVNSDGIVEPETNDTQETLIDSAIKHFNINVEEVEADTLDDGSENVMVWSNNQGLRIEWETKRNDNKIKDDDVVLLNFEARVARGEVYDSNLKIGNPIPIKLGIGQLIKGWEIGLLQMHIGDKGRIMIPSKLAYGQNGYLGKVPQNADIIVDLEIIDKIEPITIEELVKVYIYKKNDSTFTLPVKNQTITFDYFAFKKRSDSNAGMYDNSYSKGAPFSFKYLNDNVVDGLHIAFSKLNKGDNAFIEIPANLAYGKKGLVDLVPSNTDIVYDVRIHSIK